MALTDNLAFYLKLDEASGDALDATANAFDFTAVNSPGTGTGKLNGARAFDNASARYFTRAHDAAYAIGGVAGAAVDLTISCWIKANSLTAGFNLPTIWSKADGGMEILVDATVLKLKAGGTTVVGPTLSTATWYHVVGRLDSANSLASLTVDNGTPVTAVYTGSTDNGNPAFVGTSAQPGYESLISWDGLIDEFMFFWRTLADAEVTTLYGGGTPPAYPFSGGDTTPPTLSSRAVPAGGTTLTATLSESGCVPTSGIGGFSLSGTTATVASWAISGTTLTLTLSGTVHSGETITLTYARASTTDDIADAAGNFLADFSAASVANSSTQVPPLVAGAASSTTVKVDVAASAASGGTAPITYQWYGSTTIGFTPGGGNLLAGQTAQDLSAYAVTAGNTYYFVRRATDSAGSPAAADTAQYTVSAVAGTAGGVPLIGGGLIR